mgnify:CR=1 FL=1
MDEDGIIEAINQQSMFNLIDVNEGDKVDFWILKDEPFDNSRFSRKYKEKILDMNINLSSAEDTILAKLKWAKLSGGSEKQFMDALRIYEVQAKKLSQDYLDKWAKFLKIEKLLEELKAKAEII